MADLYSWGDGLDGLLGSGSTAERRAPVLVSSGWRAVSQSSTHALGVKDDGTLWAWGRNANNQLGTGGATGTPTLTPTQVGSASNWLKASAGDNCSVAIKTDGTLWGWGRNFSGQLAALADGTAAPTLMDARVWSDVQVTQGGTYVLLASGEIYGTGWNASGQLGIGSAASSAAVLTLAAGGTTWSALARMSMSYDAAAAIKADGSYWYAGRPDLDGVPGAISATVFTQGAAGPWAMVATAGDGFVLGLKTDGTLWSWGFNSNGVLGDGTTINKLLPAQIGTAANWSAVSAGFVNALAYNTVGELWVWGDNFNGQVGDGTTVKRLSPTLVLTGVSAALAGNYVTYALKAGAPPTFWTAFQQTREVQ